MSAAPDRLQELDELDRARSQIAALEQLLEVYETASLQQTARLEHSLAELAESEARLRLALEAGRMATWEWDIAGERVIWSPQMERLSGLDEGTFPGTLEAYRSMIHPDDRDASLARARDALASRAATHHLQHRIVRPAGDVRWIDSHGRFIYDDAGRPLRLVGVSRDVTEQHEVEAARDRAMADADFQRQRLAELLEQAPAAISVTEGPQHRYVMVNAMARTLLGQRDIRGKTAREAIPEVTDEALYAMLDRVFVTGEPLVAQELLVAFDRDGDGALEDGWFNIVYQPMRDTSGAVIGIMTHSVEVTEQVLARREIERKAEELTRLTRALEASNHDLDQFAYVASHDLKAPLRGISNLAAWIEEDSADRLTGESREHLRLMLGRVHRMEALIDGILQYSRAGRVRTSLERIELAPMVREVLELVAPPSGAEIVVREPMPVVQAERVPLQQVLINLIGNAIKHGGGAAARVEIAAARRDGGWQLSVRDNGPGIAPEFHDRIWGLFQTLEARDKVEGTGIGLSVVKKIVESRGGRVSVQSAPGHGATFTAWWPQPSRDESLPSEEH